MTSTTSDSIQLPTSSGDSELAQQLEGLSLDDEKVDYLSALPNELIRRIFTFAYAEKSAPRFPLNKRLLPFHYEQSLDTITVHYGRCMHRFSDAVVSSSYLGDFVRTLNVAASGEAERHCGRPSPDLKMLKGLCKKLLNLRCLDIYDAELLAHLVLNPAFAQKRLPSLSELSIEDAFERHALPYHHPPHSTPPSVAEAAHFSTLTHLRLGGMKLDKNAVLAILRASFSLCDLALSQVEAKNVDLLYLLRCLPNPCLLRSLSLYDDDHDPHSYREDLAQPLAPLPNLTHLRLAGPYDTKSPSFYTLLRTLPLIKLDIGSRMPLSPKSIRALVEPSTRHPSLKILALNNVMAIRGPKTDPDNWEDVWRDHQGEPDVPPGWVLPVWPQGWNARIACRIAEAAKLGGVKIEGMTFEAAAIKEDYDAEERKLEIYLEIIEEGAPEVDDSWDGEIEDAAEDADDEDDEQDEDSAQDEEEKEDEE
ncbi:hypothetical protein JCM10207_008512 [Rhodosporidiobolus poonsookiae]